MFENVNRIFGNGIGEHMNQVTWLRQGSSPSHKGSALSDYISLQHSLRQVRIFIVEKQTALLLSSVKKLSLSSPLLCMSRRVNGWIIVRRRRSFQELSYPLMM